MEEHPIELLISKADTAIIEEDFDTLLELYTDDALLVVEPGKNAVGKKEIRKAFGFIAEFFKHGLEVEQAGMEILETGDTALVLARTIIAAPNQPKTERKATYVFSKNKHGNWLCAIDNSYGHEVLG